MRRLSRAKDGAEPITPMTRPRSPRASLPQGAGGGAQRPPSLDRDADLGRGACCPEEPEPARAEEAEAATEETRRGSRGGVAPRESHSASQGRGSRRMQAGPEAATAPLRSRGSTFRIRPSAKSRSCPPPSRFRRTATRSPRTAKRRSHARKPGVVAAAAATGARSRSRRMRTEAGKPPRPPTPSPCPTRMCRCRSGSTKLTAAS
jgi:hypothetical protein